MQERFSERARHVMALASREANRLQHDHVAPEHILLGLLAQGECVAATVLTHAGVNLAQVRQDLDRQVQAGDAVPEVGRRPFNPQTKAVIDHAIGEARKLGHRHVGTEHLLLGLLTVEDTLAARILIGQGIKIDDMREEILAVLHDGDEAGMEGAPKAAFEWMHQQELAKAFRSPEFWHMLTMATDSANRLGQGEINAVHLLLAMLRDPKNIAGRILADKGVTADWVRERLNHYRSGSSTA